MDSEGIILKPLSEEEQELLREMYLRRKRFFIFVCCFVVLYAILNIFYTLIETDAPAPFSAPTYLLCLAAVLVPAGITGMVIYNKRIRSLKKDMEAGVKQARLYQVTMKQVFEHTGQYFISTNDPKYLHHEVDAGTYEALSVGHFFAVYFAPHSGYVFNRNGRYTLM